MPTYKTNFRKAVRLNKLQRKNHMVGQTFSTGTSWPASICRECGEHIRICECPETLEVFGPIATRLNNQLWREE